MSRYCPLRNDIVLYLDCLECDIKACKDYKYLRQKKIEADKKEKAKRKKKDEVV